MKTPTEYIKEAWAIYTKKENFIFFARIMAILVLLSTVIGFVTGYFYSTDYVKNIDFSNIPMLIGFIVISLISIILGLWSQTTQYFAILKIGESEKEVFKLGYKNIWKFFLITLVLGLIIIFGAIIIIIPAIIFGVWYSFSIFLVLDKNMGIKEALKTSKLMVSGRFWKVLGRSAVFVLFTIVISILLSIIPYAGNLLVAFIAPLFMLPSYLLYRDLGINN
ncbi:MAG: hypothetical protein ACD_19C00182G0045 [uncultured bacterium]|nr:MAG: hypothetical protein ACD_19C00182G0045 [uncultured bacterium]